MILPLKLEFSVVAYVCQNPDGKYLSPCMELKRYITFDIGHMRSCDTLKRFRLDNDSNNRFKEIT